MMLLPTPSVRTQQRLTRLMQVILLGIASYGLVGGQPKSISNGAIALLITFLPAVLERNYEIPLDPWLALWITSAVFLHTLGSAGLYTLVPWWDHVTHALSASLVAGVGYTAVRAVDLHSDEILIPRRFAFVYLGVVVLAFGVTWELFEFALDVFANATSLQMPLAQQGLDDTVRDLLFNSLGALLVAVFGQIHLHDVAETVRGRLLAEP
jgi:AcrR family transcriptional regulator